jgi:hypothetical protein
MNAATDRMLGTIAAMPAQNSSIPRKIGLRESPNRPPVTRAVVSDWSTPMRQDAPMFDWAARMSSSASTATVTPAHATHGVSTPSPGRKPAMPATTAARLMTPASVMPPAAMDSVRPWRPKRTRNPVEPVRRACRTLRTPNPSPINATWSARAM